MYPGITYLFPTPLTDHGASFSRLADWITWRLVARILLFRLDSYLWGGVGSFGCPLEFPIRVGLDWFLLSGFSNPTFPRRWRIKSVGLDFRIAVLYHFGRPAWVAAGCRSFGGGRRQFEARFCGLVLGNGWVTAGSFFRRRAGSPDLTAGNGWTSLFTGSHIIIWVLCTLRCPNHFFYHRCLDMCPREVIYRWHGLYIHHLWREKNIFIM